MGWQHDSFCCSAQRINRCNCSQKYSFCVVLVHKKKPWNAKPGSQIQVMYYKGCHEIPVIVLFFDTLSRSVDGEVWIPIKKETSRGVSYVLSLAYLSIHNTLWQISMCLSSSLLSAPLLHLYLPILAFLSNFLHYAVLLLVTISPSLSESYSISFSPLKLSTIHLLLCPPTFILFYFLAWRIAETGPILCRTACEVSLTTTTVSPPIPSVFVHWLSHIARR